MKWGLLVTEEFFNQGDEELKLGLPIGILNNRKTCNIAKNQTGFIDWIVIPIFKEWAKLLPGAKRNLD